MDKTVNKFIKQSNLRQQKLMNRDNYSTKYFTVWC